MDSLCQELLCGQFVPAIKVKIVYEVKKKDVAAVQKPIKVRSDLLENLEIKRSIFQKELKKVQDIEQTENKSFSNDAPNVSVVTMHPAELLRLIRQRKQLLAQPALPDDCKKRKFLSTSESEEMPAKKQKYKFNPKYVWPSYENELTKNKNTAAFSSPESVSKNSRQNTLKTKEPSKRKLKLTAAKETTRTHISFSEDSLSSIMNGSDDDADDDDDDLELEQLAKNILREVKESGAS